MKEVAVGILTREGRVLACRRPETARYPLKWEFPGGKLEAGETPHDALRRELIEELGIDAAIGREFHRQEWTYEGTGDRPEPPSSYRVFYYMVPSFRGNLVNKAFHEIRWVTAVELAGMDLLEGNREAVRLLMSDGQ